MARGNFSCKSHISGEYLFLLINLARLGLRGGTGDRQSLSRHDGILVASPMTSHLWPLRACSLSGAQGRKVGRKQSFPAGKIKGDFLEEVVYGRGLEGWTLTSPLA